MKKNKPNNEERYWEEKDSPSLLLRTNPHPNPRRGICCQGKHRCDSRKPEGVRGHLRVGTAMAPAARVHSDNAPCFQSTGTSAPRLNAFNLKRGCQALESSELNAASTAQQRRKYDRRGRKYNIFFFSPAENQPLGNFLMCQDSGAKTPSFLFTSLMTF